MADQTTRPQVPVAMEDDSAHRRLLAIRTNAAFMRDGSEPMIYPAPMKSYAVADLPAASLWEGSIVYVSDETGGATLAFSDGTDWRKVHDRLVVS